MNTLAVVHSRALFGLSAPSVSVEVHLANGLPAFNIVGLPETSVRESRERVRAALLQSGVVFPNHRITVNLAPADLPKESGRFDLPIAIGIAAASGMIPLDALNDVELVGELSLSGELRPIRAALAVAAGVFESARPRSLILPAANLDEARQSGLSRLYGARTLTEIIRHLDGSQPLPPSTDTACASSGYDEIGVWDDAPDMADVIGQTLARRALEISASGLHPLLLSGSPGTGKSLLAQRLPGLLPRLTPEEALQTAMIRSASGRPTGHLDHRPPLLCPHHTITAAGLLGGGHPPRPGDISLAHRGVLFLDELAEFKRAVIEALREPLETGRITLSRGTHSETFPARFLLIGATNPCPCGHLGDPSRPCRCTPAQIRRYQARISGPLLERFDLGVTMVRETTLPSARSDTTGTLHTTGTIGSADTASSVGTDSDAPSTAGSKTGPATRADHLPDTHLAPESSASIARRVQAAHHRQQRRQGCCNAHLPASRFDACLGLQSQTRELLAQAAERFCWSLRSQHKALRVARTIADLEGSDTLSPAHLAEAMALRRSLDHWHAEACA
ncbi:MAG: YifB family Mg chelatase-like AAA ATPase [Lautropia sp.]|nr:YifB family Mg chelatase-like AAA ATPase [Lautropia sp.]